MKVFNLIAKARSIRRYKENEPVSDKQLRYIAEAARIVPSAGNRQRLRLMLINDERRDAIFKELTFAGHLHPEWTGPKEGERPVAYIVIMTEETPDTNLAIDIGIAAEALLLSATDEGLGGCMFRSFNKEKLSEILGHAPYKPELVISIGKPDEVVILQDANDVRPDGNLAYYRNAYGHHLVPKISIEDLILE